MRRILGRPWLASVALFVVFIAIWQVMTASGSADVSAVDPAKVNHGVSATVIPPSMTGTDEATIASHAGAFVVVEFGNDRHADGVRFRRTGFHRS